MKIIDEKVIMLNDGEKSIKVKVYLKEVFVKNNHIKIKAFCRKVSENAIRSREG